MTDSRHDSWDAPGLLPPSEPKRVARYRRLQSWYREVQLGAPAGKFGSYDPLGSYLDPKAVKQQRDLNFLHPSAYEHAETRSIEVQAEGGALDPTRLFHNMLSSMPMCFNLFGAMRGEHDAFLPVFTSLFDDEATAISEIVCEWAPPDADARIGDRTAFDAVIFYEAGDQKRFIGIETKYTEPFSRRVYESQRYTDVTAGCGWFVHPESAADSLKGPKSNQLWRNVLLAAALDSSGQHGRGSVAVVALDGDSGAETAVELVGSTLADSHIDRLRLVSIETVLAAIDAMAPELSWWATSFRRRYLRGDLPDDPSAARDPLGPVLGRPIFDTQAAARASSAGTG
ncbi:PGN_0703 family putative restriction endonuclease [Aeromicrobium stalagmiti]|uniref:PGN_0703 family putative restriction endonuclease n=1 Tax=Aeromicrobium stalagmiti TaxID=2738988 RepID=UPI00156814A1|nr:hypothetical protein [Aeromicrobium stalagmiti]NRQ50412.1 hypothetical protein [Aeromicrobium stalagmiti]